MLCGGTLMASAPGTTPCELLLAKKPAAVALLAMVSVYCKVTVSLGALVRFHEYGMVTVHFPVPALTVAFAVASSMTSLFNAVVLKSASEALTMQNSDPPVGSGVTSLTVKLTTSFPVVGMIAAAAASSSAMA